ncbi:uncharacterized protein LOC135833002 [Planococcus citri]|uniref:uncharacterized protein LOC135833002 n=1 Tax=Planococcus citri TaxID=170843 RepID=UPI0031FA3CEF
MQKLLLLFSILLCAIQQVKSDANLDYFIMSEAYLPECRANEDANTGFSPFYVACTRTNNGCEPAIPILNNDEGYVTIIPDEERHHIYYGCIADLGENLFNSEYFRKALVLRKAIKPVTIRSSLSFEYCLETRKQRCRSEVSPQIWIASGKSLGVVSYSIGFIIVGSSEVTLAEVHFSCDIFKIPVRTKHFVHGVSLAVPIAPDPLEELIYEGNSVFFKNWELEDCMISYERFNETDSYSRKKINEYLKLNKLDTIPESEKIVKAHLIPEYDMIDPSWKKVSRFAQTIIPMWEELYLGIWADVEEIIREVAFMNQRKLTVFSGIHEQLAFNAEPFTRFFYLNERNVAVPEMIWKMVVDENYRVNNKKAIVIIIRNISKELENLNIFAEIKPPSCQKTCGDFGWTSIDKPNVYCCEVNEVKNLINELPDIAGKQNFDMLFSNYTY